MRYAWVGLSLAIAAAAAVPLASMAIGDPHLNAVKKTIADKTPDPEATRFRDLRVVKDLGEPSGMPTGTYVAVCGFLNAKNRQGGYVGYRPFYATSFKTPGGYHVIPTLEGTTFEADIDKNCQGV